MQDEAVPGGQQQPTLGRWSFDVTTGLATYDEDLLALYGVDLTNPGDPREVQDRIHPDDVDAVRETTAGALTAPGPVTSRYRFRTGTRGERIFVAVGDPVREEGRITAIAGYTVDVTDSARRETNDAVRASRERGSAIEQVKGALMAAYALDEDVAFELLRRSSMDHNVKAVDLAGAVVARLADPQDRFHRSGDLSLLQLVEQTASAHGARPA